MQGRDAGVGLCSTCRHAQRVETPRSVFWRCRLAETDPRFERYPRLPVITCEGYRPASGPPEPPPDARGSE
ncbi:MAG: hypothetical protein A2V63_08285 [Candidatus Eisenbacteria bacterium RBG_19FT_COMBO_70_11]|nr:MAG: hypothetical protein A2V63_08285 [Candidatus Eisenbacteria bacterium RBG_19FT_COMBO_70_11]